MSEQFSIKAPPRLELVTCAEQEPTAGETAEQPSPRTDGPHSNGPAARVHEAVSRSADLTLVIPQRPRNLSDDDLRDLGYAAGTLLPRIHEASHELHQSIADRNPAWTIAALRRFVALGAVAKDRADSLERRLP